MRTLLLCLAILWAQTSIAEEARIHVTGVGSTLTAPDHARFQFEIAATSASAADAQETVEQTLSKVISGLENFDIESNTLQAAHLNVTPQYRWQPDQRKRVFEGYQVTRRASFTLGALEQIGAVYQALVQRGATSVSPAVLDTHARPALETQMLAAAYDHARRQAEAIAKASGGTLGPALEVTSQTDGFTPRPMVARMSAEAADAGNAVYDPGQLEIRKQLAVTFALENNAVN